MASAQVENMLISPWTQARPDDGRRRCRSVVTGQGDHVRLSAAISFGVIAIDLVSNDVVFLPPD